MLKKGSDTGVAQELMGPWGRGANDCDQGGPAHAHIDRFTLEEYLSFRPVTGLTQKPACPPGSCGGRAHPRASIFKIVYLVRVIIVLIIHQLTCIGNSI